MSYQDHFSTVYQAVSPAALAELKRYNWSRLQPSSFGDTMVLLKPSRRRATDAARHVWCRRFNWSAVIELSVYTQVLERFPEQTVAYDEHREIVVPVSALTELSAALSGPVRVVETLVRPSGDRQLAFMRRALGGCVPVESFC